MKQVQFLFAKRSSLCIKKYPTPASERGVQKGKTLEEIQFKSGYIIFVGYVGGRFSGKSAWS
jgi:hypothetical protein